MQHSADYAIFINTGQEYDGSDAGARPDEAISWGKIKLAARPVKIYTDATLVFPLIVAQTFAQHHKLVQTDAESGARCRTSLMHITSRKFAVPGLQTAPI
jgi:deoxyhypusine synthase